MNLDFRDRRGAPSLGRGNRTATTVFAFAQKIHFPRIGRNEETAALHASF